jgi:hypothetical protein
MSMSRPSLGPHLWAIALAFAPGVWLVAPPAHGGDAWPACGPPLAASEARILAVLQEDTQIEFIDTPFEEVLTFLSDAHSLPIRVDIRALDNVGLETDMPVTANFRGISLASALKHLLDDLDMTFLIHNEMLLVTTEDAAAKYAVVRVYDVSKLIGDDQDASELWTAVTQVLQGTAPRKVTHGGMGGYPGMASGYEEEAGYGVEEGYGGGFGSEEMYGGSGGEGYGVGGVVGGAVPSKPAGPLPQITPFRHLLIVRDTTLGHQRFSQLLGAIATGLGCDDRHAPSGH